MEQSIVDKAVDILLERRKRLDKELAKRFAKTRPFRTTPVSSDEALIQYNMLTQQDIQNMIATDGTGKTNKYIQDMEILKSRRMTK